MRVLKKKTKFNQTFCLIILFLCQQNLAYIRRLGQHLLKSNRYLTSRKTRKILQNFSLQQTRNLSKMSDFDLRVSDININASAKTYVNFTKYPAFLPRPAFIQNINYKRKIPFYIYQGENYPNIYQLCQSYTDFDFNSQHADDLVFYTLASKHSWRVLDPEQAEVFIIPAMLSFAHESHLRFKDQPVNNWNADFAVNCGMNPKLSNLYFNKTTITKNNITLIDHVPVKNYYDLLESLAENVMQSKYFQAQPEKVKFRLFRTVEIKK